MTRTLIRPIPALIAFWLIACAGAIANAASNDTPTSAATAALLAEVRRAFTVRGKPIPPEIFRDFGDGDLADSAAGIWVTVDIEAATGSNLYYDDIKGEKGYRSQKKAGSDEATGYTYIGATENGLLVVLADYSGGGSGDFVTLHILDIAAVRSYDDEGKIYQRVLLTNLRSIALGDRWDGDVSISRNSIRIVTKRNGPADEKPRAPVTIEAKRP
jgi:hypothetical protein